MGQETTMTTRADETPQQIVERDIAAQVQGGREGQLSVYTCPECHGALWQVTEANTPEFHCHVGHVLSGQTLLYVQRQSLEVSLWSSIRGLAASFSPRRRASWAS